MSMKVLNWGVAGCGLIANDFVRAVTSDANGLNKFVSVASRSLASAQKLATKFAIPNAYASYVDLAKDASVDVVYVANLNTDHFETAKLFLENGKHVLLEKPLTMNAKQAKAITALAQSKKLFLMEALWSRFLPAYVFAHDQIAKGVIGEVVHVSVDFGVPIASLDRISQREQGGGTILDLGVYAINFVQQAFGNDVPEQILAAGQTNEFGVDVAVSAVLKYSQGRLATLTTHSRVQHTNEGRIVGTKGYIKFVGPFFHVCQSLVVNDVPYQFPVPSSPVDDYNFNGSSGLLYEANEVRRVILVGGIQSDVMPHRDSITIATIQDELRKQVGVTFDADNFTG